MKENLRKIILDALHASHKTEKSLEKESSTYRERDYSGDIATEADLKMEEAVISSLEKSGISAQVISEEKGEMTINTKTPPKYLITIDPLDGSNNFVHARGIMPYATTMALFSTAKTPRFSDILCAGTIEHTKGNIWLAEKGKGTTLNKKPCIPSKKTEIDEKGKYVVDFFYQKNWKLFSSLIKGKKKINIHDYGSSAFHYAMLSSGHIDAMMNATQKAHELAPAYLLIKESGAIITDLKGSPLDNIPYDFNKKYPVLAASTKRLHTEILKKTRQLKNTA